MGHVLERLTAELEVQEKKDKKPKKPKKEKQDYSPNGQVIQWLKTHYEFRFNLIRYALEFRKTDDTEDFKQLDDKAEHSIFWRMTIEAGITYSMQKMKSLILSDYISEKWNAVSKFYQGLEPKAGDEYFNKVLKSIILKELDEPINGFGAHSLFRKLFRRWLISCYNCNMGRGANQVCLVLVGRQGTYKSTWLDALCPKPIADYGVRVKLDLNVSNKDTLNLLAEKAFLNVDDQLVGLFRKDHDTIKNLITQQEVSVRKAYAAHESQRKRIANFMASVNDANFLTDTENRRYLCFEVHKCNPSELDQETIIGLWREVKYWVEIEQEQTYFNNEEQTLQRLLNENFTAISPEKEWLNHFFEPIHEGIEDKHYWLHSQILEFLLSKVKVKISGKVLSNELERAGFEKRSKKISGKSTRYWIVNQIREYVDSVPKTQTKTETDLPF